MSSTVTLTFNGKTYTETSVPTGETPVVKVTSSMKLYNTMSIVMFVLTCILSVVAGLWVFTYTDATALKVAIVSFIALSVVACSAGSTFGTTDWVQKDDNMLTRTWLFVPACLLAICVFVKCLFVTRDQLTSVYALPSQNWTLICSVIVLFIGSVLFTSAYA